MKNFDDIFLKYDCNYLYNKKLEYLFNKKQAKN